MNNVSIQYVENFNSRFENFWEIAFIRQKNIPSHPENRQRPFSLLTSSVAHGEQQAALGPLPSPNGKLVSTFPPDAVSVLITPLRIN